jgi:hypothetical protein
MKESEKAKAWLRQLLLIRYNLLLQNLKAHFPVNQQEEEALTRTILNIQWLESAVTQSRSDDDL